MSDRAVHWRRPAGRRPWVLGHRGARHAAPENTLAAFELSAREGADGIELDVRLTADREIVVIHDPTLERVTQGRDTRAVETLTRNELQGIDVGSGERAPTLRDVLAWASERGQRVNVELKRDVRELRVLVWRVAKLVRQERNLSQSILLSSFHPGAVAALARLAPDVSVCWLVHARQRFLQTAPGWRWLGATGVHAEHVLATPARLAAWQRAGALTGVWTVNEETTAARLAAAGVDTLISDTPGKILQALIASAA